ncbi:hypothetical protein I552_9724 [Mycobacterium xenopi 3993]|nr:hypothetical protein I552_9724 [Mycobacterium xenopi 3993]
MGRSIVADVIDTVDPAVMAVVFRTISAFEVSTLPWHFTVSPAESRMRKNVAVPVAAALGSGEMEPNVALAALPVSENPDIGVAAQVSWASCVLPLSEASALAGGVRCRCGFSATRPALPRGRCR